MEVLTASGWSPSNDIEVCLKGILHVFCSAVYCLNKQYCVALRLRIAKVNENIVIIYQPFFTVHHLC